MKICIYGGSFDPVHNGHVNLVRSAIAELSPDEVRVIPAAVSPFKQQSMPMSDKKRLMLVRAAFNGMEKVTVDDRELKRGGVSYAIDTVKELRLEFPDSEFVFLIGADSEAGLSKWKDYDELVRLCSFHVMPRTEESSTEVRRRLASGENFDDLLPYAVAEFLKHDIEYADDERVVDAVLKGLKKKGGYCPCRIPKLPGYFCPCDEFKMQMADAGYHGLCHCRLYKKK